MRDFHLPGRSPVMSTKAAVATSHPLAAQTAIDILKSGGNAMDAAIAGAMVLTIAEPQMCGMGGDCFALYTRAGEAEVRALNGSGRAPQGADAADLRAAGKARVPLFGAPEAVTTPTAIDGFCHLAETEGRMGIDRLLAPAIDYAEHGLPVSPRVASDWKACAGNLHGAARQHFLINGTEPQVGEIFSSKGQAEVMRRIAKDGRAGFYEGEVAEDIISTLQGLGGVHQMSDMAAARSDAVDPIFGTYKGADLYEHPPNGQGATALLMLNILSQFDLAALDPFGAQRAHLEAEAAKLAYDARDRFLADPAFTDGLDHMLSVETAGRLAALIDPHHAMELPVAARTEAVHKDTIYITVVDEDRMSVSLIFSIFHGFGSGIASEKFGILLQNRGAGFSLVEGHPNEMKGGKRPMHTIIPAILCEGGKVRMPFGVMGGAYQPNGHARMITNMRDYGLDPQASVDAPRSFADMGKLMVERGYSDEVRAKLTDMGHEVEVPKGPLGGAQAIYIRDNGVLEAASDPRKDGCAMGY
ncbi:gamma-glutamyltransferase family protein [Litorivita sp. NS0012-18]|uniref:gamma-glutamyltransferase family protein n=1 Tax=Litorivita sp. NS0012-18 TaxID=3127655 RepID=UPI003108286B